jgi:hypothetical protein
LISGCSSGSSEQTTITPLSTQQITLTPTPTFTPISTIPRNNALEVMKWFPDTGGTYGYVNLAALREPQFSHFYQPFASQLSIYADYGMDFDYASWEALQYKGDDTYAILINANWNISEIRKELQVGGIKGSYRGVEIWTAPTEGAVALRDGLLLLGEPDDTVYKCIDALKGLERSLYDNEDLREVVGKLPRMALTYEAATSGELFPTDIADCIAIAFSAEKIDANTVGLTFVGKFTDATSAKNSLSEFKSWAITSTKYSIENVKAEQEGQFIEVTMTYPISELGTCNTTPTETGL